MGAVKQESKGKPNPNIDPKTGNPVPRCKNGHIKCSGDCNTPTPPFKWVWEEWINDAIREFFTFEDTWEERVKTTGPNSETTERISKRVPTLAAFHRKYGLGPRCTQTWAAEEKKLAEAGLPPKRPGFLDAFTYAKEQYEDFLYRNGLEGIFNPQAFKFTMVTTTDVREPTVGDSPTNPLHVAHAIEPEQLERFLKRHKKD